MSSSAVAASAMPGAGSTKGERTRARLKWAAREVLGERGYRAARIADITRAAGLSQGAFYPYFKNKREIALDVLKDVIEEGRTAMTSLPHSDDPFEQIHAPTRAYVHFLFAHAPLVRVLLQAADEDEVFAALWQRTGYSWLAQVAEAIEHHCGSPGVDESTRLFVAYAMNWMVDGFLHSLLGRRDPHQEAAVQSSEQLAEALSVLWFRAVYARNPEPERLTCTHDILRLQLAGTDGQPRFANRATNVSDGEEPI